MNSSIWVTWWWLFIVINIGFFIFNLIPFPPLDGSRILYAFAPEFLQNIMAKMESLGFMAIVVFMLVLFPAVSPLLQRADNWLVALFVGI
jgi:Zn-dependent protease